MSWKYLEICEDWRRSSGLHHNDPLGSYTTFGLDPLHSHPTALRCSHPNGWWGWPSTSSAEETDVQSWKKSSWDTGLSLACPEWRHARSVKPWNSDSNIHFPCCFQTTVSLNAWPHTATQLSQLLATITATQTTWHIFVHKMIETLGMLLKVFPCQCQFTLRYLGPGLRMYCFSDANEVISILVGPGLSSATLQWPVLFRGMIYWSNFEAFSILGQRDLIVGMGRNKNRFKPPGMK